MEDSHPRGKSATKAKGGESDWRGANATLLQRLEEGSRLREGRFRALIENADFISVVDSKGTVLYHSSGADRGVSFLPEDVAKKNGFDWVHPDDRAMAMQILEELVPQAGAKVVTELRARRPDGSWRNLEVIATNLLHDAAVKGIVLNSRDITKYKQAEEALRESEGRFRMMADSAPVMIWMAGIDKRCTYFNRPWLEFTGRSMEQESGDGWAEGVHPEDLPRCVQTYVSSFDARREFQMEYRLRRRDGEFRWILDHGIPRLSPANEILGYIGSCIDITERKQVEMVVRASEARLAGIVHSAMDAIISINEGQKIVLFNPAAEQMFRCTVSEAVGHSLDRFIPASLRAAHREHVAKFGETGGTMRRMGRLGVLHGVRTDGTQFPIEASISQVELNGEKLYTVILRDITERVSTENKLAWMASFPEVNPSPMAEVDLENGTVLYANPMASRLFPGLKAIGLQHPWLSGIADLFPASTHSKHQSVDREVQFGDATYHQVINRPFDDARLRVYGFDVTGRKQAEEQLREVSQRLSYHVDNSPLAVIEWDKDWRLIRWSGGAERVFGWKAEEVMGKRFDDFRWVYAADAEYVRRVAAVLTAGVNRFSSNRNYRKDGSVIHCEWYNSSLLDGSGELRSILSLVLDVTERKRAEEALQEAHDDLEIQVEERTADLRRAHQTLRVVSESCNHVLATIEDEPSLVPEICRTIVKHGGYAAVWVSFPEGDKERSVRLETAPELPGAKLEPFRISWRNNPFGRGPTGVALRMGQVSLVADCFTDPRMAPWRKLLQQRRYRSGIALPLKSRGITIGALTIYSRERSAFAPDQVALLTDLANDLAFGIVALRARAERDEALRRLEQKAVQLRALAGELIQTEQRERRRFATILHDHLQQLLYAARCRVDALQQANSPASVKRMIRHVDALLSQCLTSSRSLTSEIYPPVPEDAGLAVTLKWLSQWFRETHGLAVRVNAVEVGEWGPDDMRTTLFQAVREALFNAVKHARVKRASVTVTRPTAGTIQIVVSDRGAGFNTSELMSGPGADGRFGLFSIRERLESLGASMRIESAPGRGTRVIFRAPV